MSKTRSITGIMPALILLAGLVLPIPASARPHPQQEESQPPFEVDDRIQPPVKLSVPPVVYPEAAREKRVEGSVRLRGVIDEEGRVAELEAIDKLPLGLTGAAMDAVRKWSFQPATLEGEPVTVDLHVTINFRLGDARRSLDVSRSPISSAPPPP